jgi:hypothetical protein
MNNIVKPELTRRDVNELTKTILVALDHKYGTGEDNSLVL